MLQELDSDLAKLQECIDSIGTPLDNHTNRAEIKRLRNAVKTKVTNAKSGLRDKKKSHQSPQEKILANRQAAQLDGQISKFQRLLDKEKTAVKQHPHPGKNVRWGEEQFLPHLSERTMSMKMIMHSLSLQY